MTWIIIAGGLLLVSLVVKASSTAMKSGKKEDIAYDDFDKNEDDIVEDEEQINEDKSDDIVRKKRIRNAIISSKMSNNRHFFDQDKEKLSSDTVSFDNSNIKVPKELEDKKKYNNNNERENDDKISLKKTEEDEKEVMKFDGYEMIGLFDQDGTGEGEMVFDKESIKKENKIFSCKYEIKIPQEGTYTNELEFRLKNVEKVSGKFDYNGAVLDEDLIITVRKGNQDGKQQNPSNNNRKSNEQHKEDEENNKNKTIELRYKKRDEQLEKKEGIIIAELDSEGNADGEGYLIRDGVVFHGRFKDDYLIGEAGITFPNGLKGKCFFNEEKEITNGIIRFKKNNNACFVFSKLEFDNSSGTFSVEKGTYSFDNNDPESDKLFDVFDQKRCEHTGSFSFHNLSDISYDNRIKLIKGEKSKELYDDNIIISGKFSQEKNGFYGKCELDLDYHSKSPYKQFDVSRFVGEYDSNTKKGTGKLYFKKKKEGENFIDDNFFNIFDNPFNYDDDNEVYECEFNFQNRDFKPNSEVKFKKDNITYKVKDISLKTGCKYKTILSAKKGNDFELEDVQYDDNNDIVSIGKIKCKIKDKQYIITNVTKGQNGNLKGTICYEPQVANNEQRQKYCYEGNIVIKNIEDPERITIYPEGEVTINRKLKVDNKDCEATCKGTFVEENNEVFFEGEIDYGNNVKLKGKFDKNCNLIAGNKYSSYDIKTKLNNRDCTFCFKDIELSVNFASFIKSFEVKINNNETVKYTNVTLFLDDIINSNYINLQRTSKDDATIEYNNDTEIQGIKRIKYTGKVSKSLPCEKGTMVLMKDNEKFIYEGKFENGSPSEGKLKKENNDLVYEGKFNEKYEKKEQIINNNNINNNNLNIVNGDGVVHNN